MFAPEGYNSFLRLKLIVRASLLRQCLKQLKRMRDSKTENAYSGHVMECAASLVSYSAVDRFDSSVTLFAGAKQPFMKLPRKLTKPPFTLSLKEEYTKGESHHYVSFTEMFKSGELAEAISEGRFEAPRVSIGYLSCDSVVNYVTGCIDTSFIQGLAKIDQIKTKLDHAKREYANAAASMAGVMLNTDRLIPRQRSEGVPHFGRGAHNSLKGLDGYPVFLLEDDFKIILESLDIDSAKYTGEQRIDPEPHELILAEYAAQPATKDEIKTRLFPDMSYREYEHHWWFAGKSNPAIKSPGRKS